MTAALVAFALVIGLSFFGVRIAFAALLVGFGGVALERGVNAAFTMLGQQVLEDAMNYNLSVIPLFVLMGTFHLPLRHFGGFVQDSQSGPVPCQRPSGALDHPCLCRVLGCVRFVAGHGCNHVQGLYPADAPIWLQPVPSQRSGRGRRNAGYYDPAIGSAGDLWPDRAAGYCRPVSCRGGSRTAAGALVSDRDYPLGCLFPERSPEDGRGQ